jgi:hypothetical protein
VAVLLMALPCPLLFLFNVNIHVLAGAYQAKLSDVALAVQKGNRINA